MTPEKLYVIFDEDDLVVRVVNDPYAALDDTEWLMAKYDKYCYFEIYILKENENK